jgi:putative SOS response-associated peptidase YedK
MSLEHKMPKLNPALFEPLKRIGKSSAVRAGLRARINKVISSFLRRTTNRSGGKVKASSFRQAFAKRRCRIPADGFYEWRKTAKPKLPFAIAMKDERPFTFAPALEKTGKIPNLGHGCARARLSQGSLMSLWRKSIRVCQ